MRIRPLRRDGVPCAQISVIDAFLRILPAAHYTVRKVTADLAVFDIQFPYALLRTLEKHFYNSFIFCHHTASFPASPIYYGFGDKYYIKSETFSKTVLKAAPTNRFIRAAVILFFIKHIREFTGGGGEVICGLLRGLGSEFGGVFRGFEGEPPVIAYLFERIDDFDKVDIH